MDKTIIVNVTQEDIDQGCRKSSSSCPIARAFLRATGTAEWVNVGAVQIHWLMRSGVRYCANLPDEAIQFIAEFDRSKKRVQKTHPSPVQFELTPWTSGFQ
jgi:hypothetical protein